MTDESDQDQAVTLPQITISKADLETLDVDKLRESMLKGIYVLETALISQAGFEYDRIKKMRCMIKTLEDDLFTNESLANLDPEQKFKAYLTFIKSMSGSLNFLTELHRDVATGLEAVTSIEKMKKKPAEAVKDAEERSNLDQIKSLIEKKIKEKIEVANKE